MRSTFFGLNIGYKGLQAQQRALDVTSHNIANANTQGYTRQDVLMTASQPIKVLEGYVGTGVDVAEIRRIRDGFLDLQLRTENKSLGEWEIKSNILGNLEVIFNEPSESSLRSVMDEYWESWQDLSKNPESTAVRETVMQNGITLADTFNHTDRQFADLQEDINQGISIKIDEINSIARQLKDLNGQIVKAESDGAKANDLRDQRDLLVEQLSKIVDIGVVEDSLGAYNVTIGGSSLVNRAYINEIRYVDNEADPTASTIEWIDPLTGRSQGAVNVKGGYLKGYMTMRDEVVPGLRAEISELANRIATEVNNLHHNGYYADDQHGGDFFVKIDDNKPFSAGNIKISDEIKNDVSKIAAAAVTPVLDGDGANALAIAQLRNITAINRGIIDPPASVTGTSLTEPITVLADANQLSLTIDGTTKTISLSVSPPDYTLDTLVAELQTQLDAAFGAGVVEVSRDGAGSDQLKISSVSGSEYQGIYDISGSAANTLGIETQYKATFDDFYRSTVAQLGIYSMEAERMVENQTLLVGQLENKKEAISGVSLDEEMTNMIRFQHAYTASARVINTMDEMLELIVNRLGMVGR